MNTESRARSVPVYIAARVYRKDASWVRAGLIEGWLPIGIAVRAGKRITSISEIGKGRINYYISPKHLYEETGFVWEGYNEQHEE